MMSDGKRPGAVSAFRVPMLLLFLAAAPSAGLAQSAAPPGLPPGVYMGEPDYKPATAGTYALDPDHASVIARVSHIGYSYSIFRFDRLSATLTNWDPANMAGASLSAKVETASITSNVKGFAQELGGDKFLKSAAFPAATFVSTAFRQMSSRRGKVDGQLTVSMPLGRPLEPGDVTVEGKTRISEGRLGQTVGPYEVHGANVAIDMTTTAVEARGDMLINGGVVAKASWQHVYAAPADKQPPLRISAILDNSYRNQLGLDINDLELLNPVVSGVYDVQTAATIHHHGMGH
jgi:polyisoprenoid-binding protein YceI